MKSDTEDNDKMLRQMKIVKTKMKRKKRNKKSYKTKKKLNK